MLLICPKPLVTNWQREFALWAPELPTTVVEGDPAKRRFAWQQPMPMKIVNYEAAMAYIAWLTSPEGQALIRQFTVGGDALFRPLAVPAK